MICKTQITSSFRSCVDYVVGKVNDQQGVILEARGVRNDSIDHMISDFERGKQLRPNLNQRVWHTSISFQEEMSDSKMCDIIKDWMEEMNLGNTQYVIVRHYDNSVPHGHAIANRIDDDGKTISDSYNYFRSMRARDIVVQRFALKMVPNVRNEEKINHSRLRGRDALKSEVNMTLQDHLHRATNIAFLEKELYRKGITCNIQYDLDSKVKGIVFSKGNVFLKASDIHKDLSGPKIQLQIFQNEMKRHREQELLLEEKRIRKEREKELEAKVKTQSAEDSHYGSKTVPRKGRSF